MTVAIADYAFTHPSIAQLKAAGIKAVGRYLGQDTARDGKNLTLAEAKALSDAGIAIISLFEFAAQQPLGGAAQAAKDVALARQQRDQVGMPHDRPWYFACDFDIGDYAPNSSDPLAKLGPVGAYYQRIRAETGHNAGAYGGYWLIKRLFDAHLIEWGWQTVAWSGGQWDPRAQLRQTGASEFGGAADVDVAERADYGQWRIGWSPAQPPPPPPPPPPAQAAYGYLVTAGGAGGLAGRAVVSHDGGKSWT